MQNKKPKILLFDYETSPQIGYFFGSIWETDIVKIIRHEQILSVAWKWHGDSKVYVKGQDDFKSYKSGKLDDKELVKFFSEILKEADYVVAHNGDNFDIKVFNTRLWFHKLSPLPPEKSFDTKKLAKNKFHLPSNKLQHIADFHGIEGKLTNHGFDMWLGCEQGYKKDWDMMKAYDKQDVVVLDKIFTLMMPYVKLPAYLNKVNKSEYICPNPICKSDKLQKRGTAIIGGGKEVQRLQCQACGKWSQGDIIKSK